MQVPATRLFIIAIVALLAGGAQSAFAQGDLERGRQLAEQACSRCHATGPDGESRHEDAPAFRDLNKRYPVNDLEEALGEGIVTGHPDMPEISFPPDDAAALIDYMISIQER